MILEGTVENYFISICIPTYNRIEDLKQTVEKICSSYGNSKEVEIVICDNGSIDGTDLYLIELKERYSNVSIAIKKENMGFDKNFLDCYVLAQGKYVHFLGDDDKLINIEFENLIRNIRDTNADVIISNYTIDCTKTHYNALKNNDTNFNKLEDLFSYVGHWITFISAITLKKRIIKEERLNEYDGLGFMHIAILLELFANHEGIFIYNSIPLVVATDKNKPSYSVLELFGNNLMKIFYMKMGEVNHNHFIGFFRSIYKFIMTSNINLIQLFNKKIIIYKVSGLKLFLSLDIIITIGKLFIKKIILGK